MTDPEMCDWCAGTGELASGRTCRECHGTGQIEPDTDDFQEPDEPMPDEARDFGGVD